MPRSIRIDITPKVYLGIKERTVRRFTPLARTHVENYFEFIRNINPSDVIDSIDYGESLWDKYEKAPMGIRISIAMARAFLKASPRIQREFKKAITPSLIGYTLKFENPNAYKVIEMYGEKGQEYLKMCISDSFKIFGIKGEA